MPNQIRKLNDGFWCAYICARCPVTYKRPAPQRLQRSNIDSQECDSCGKPAKVVWGRIVSDGKDAFFVPDEGPVDASPDKKLSGK